MAVTPGRGYKFQATLQDNGVAIASSYPFNWATDDSMDEIFRNTLAAKVVAIAVIDPPAPGRTTLTTMVQAMAPSGKLITGSLGTPIVTVTRKTYDR